MAERFKALVLKTRGVKTSASSNLAPSAIYKEKRMKIYVVNFSTESCDHYNAVFNKKPNDGHLSAYVKEHYPDEIMDYGRLIFWEVEEVEVESLPEPIEPIPSI